MATEDTPMEVADENLQASEPTEEIYPSATSPTEEEQCMQISQQALGKKPTAATFSFKVNIGGECGIALLDSGSSHSFIDMHFVANTSCNTVNNPMKIVLIAGGGQLQSGSHVAQTPYTIQGHKFNNSFKILPLKGYDIILGCDWLSTHSPITMDFDNRKVLIKHQGKSVSLKDNNRRNPFLSSH